MEQGNFINGKQILPNSISGTTQAEGSRNKERNGDNNHYEQDLLFSTGNVVRVMRKILPSNAKVSDDAREAIQKCTSQFIHFITSEANERCQRQHRRKIGGDDLIWAMNKLGFDSYVDPLQVYLHRYRELEEEEKSMSSQMVNQNVVQLAPLANPGYPPPYNNQHPGVFTSNMNIPLAPLATPSHPPVYNNPHPGMFSPQMNNRQNINQNSLGPMGGVRPYAPTK